jgi:hypothetical protein
VTVRVQKTTQLTMSHTFIVDDVATDAAGAVTVNVKRWDGTVVQTGTASHTSGNVGQYDFVVTGGSAGTTAQLDALTVEWTGTIGGAAVTVADDIEVVGGFWFGIAQLRARHKVFANASTYPGSALADSRIIVENEGERITRQAWVPRFAVETLSGGLGNPFLGLRWPTIRKIRSVKVGGVAWAQADVDTIGWDESGLIYRGQALVAWPVGVRNIVIEYEHGNDRAPLDLADAAMLRMRTVVPRPTSPIPDRAQSYSTEEGGVYALARADEEHTGIPDVDAVYRSPRYRKERRAVIA